MSVEDNVTGTLRSQSKGHEPVVFPISTMAAMSRHGNDRIGIGIGNDGDPAPTLSKAHSHAVGTATAVRRLTPTECERLQGFPDGWTLVPWRGKQAPDGPRYKALGNSMAVPVMSWIGQRIQIVQEDIDAALAKTSPQPRFDRQAQST